MFGECRSRGVIEARCAWGLIDWAALGWAGRASCRRRVPVATRDRELSRKRGEKRRGNLERSTLQTDALRNVSCRAAQGRERQERRGEEGGEQQREGDETGGWEKREARKETISRGFSSTRNGGGSGDGGGWETKPNRWWLLLPSGSAAHRTWPLVCVYHGAAQYLPSAGVAYLGTAPLTY